MNIFSLCCFFLHSNFLDIISHLSHIIASLIITNLFYLFSALFPPPPPFLALIVLLCLICLYFMFTPTFYFRSVYCFFRAAKSWASVCHYTFYFFPFPLKMEILGQKSGLLQSHTQRGNIVVELKWKHPMLFIAVYFLGLGCLWCSWATFVIHVAEAMLLFFNSCTGWSRSLLSASVCQPVTPHRGANHV